MKNDNEFDNACSLLNKITEEYDKLSNAKDLKERIEIQQKINEMQDVLQNE